MNTPIKTSLEQRVFRSASILIAFASLALLPKAQAVVPPPDGGYPNFTTAEGTNALKNLTTGAANTAVGWYSLFSNTDGSFNTAVGAGTLLFNNADENTAFGAAALLFNTTGANNTAVGAAALLNNTGEENTATGHGALLNNTTGSFNTADGAGALYFNSSGAGNTATGFQALLINATGSFNMANGYQALYSNTTGVSNTALGDSALHQNTTGSYNTATGFTALSSNTTGVSNTALGDSAGFSVTTADDVICIGANVGGENVSNTCYIGNIFGVTSAGATGVVVNSTGKLGTIVSSRRFKDDIKPMDQASEALFALQPVSFHYKKEIDPKGVPQFGLVAEDVEAVNPDLVVRDAEGKVNSVRYEAVNAMLLNEFLKARRQIDAQQKQIDALTAVVQKVSAQLELNKAAPQTALKNQ